MTVRLSSHTTHRILMPQTVHPHYRQVVKTIVSQSSIEIIEVPFDLETGSITLKQLEPFSNDPFTTLVIPQPNFFGILEEVDALTDWAHARGAFVIGVVNPLTMALLKPPGQWGEKGADIACGEGQPLGVPMASGGPYYGFLCCKKSLVRQLPGRIVGRTVDCHGKRGFVLTLQAREQHIRRAKATSNICTNQGLLVTASTIYMSLLGPKGLRNVALKCHALLTLLKDKLQAIPTVKICFKNISFHELVVQLPISSQDVLMELAQMRIQGGFDLTPFYSELPHCILICVTETKRPEDIHFFVERLAAILNKDHQTNKIVPPLLTQRDTGAHSHSSV
jgi:glycine dehydrogenase subunit 1